MIGRSVEEFLRPLHAGPGSELPIAATLADGRPRQVEKTEIRGAGGKPLPVRLVVTPIERRLSSLRAVVVFRSEEHTSELQSLMRISYAGFCLKKKKKYNNYR